LPAAGAASEPGLLLEFERPLGDGRYRVVAVDVNSRINVNLATEQMLTTLLAEAGRPANDAEALAQAILDWIDGDDLRRAQGAEAAEYRRLGLDHLPRNGPIATLEELLHVRGMTPEIPLRRGERPLGVRAPAIRDRAVVDRAGSGRINLNTAPREVLAALPGFTPAVVAVVLDLRQRRWIWSISDVAADRGYRRAVAGGSRAAADQTHRARTRHRERLGSLAGRRVGVPGGGWMSRPYSCTGPGSQAGARAWQPECASLAPMRRVPGFTLIEVVIAITVTAIVAIAVYLAASTALASAQRSRAVQLEARTQRNARMVLTALLRSARADVARRTIHGRVGRAAAGRRPGFPFARYPAGDRCGCTSGWEALPPRERWSWRSRHAGARRAWRGRRHRRAVRSPGWRRDHVSRPGPRCVVG